MSSIGDEVLNEVEALHQFIAAWFRGEEASSPENFNVNFSDRLDSEFLNVQPAGRILSRDDLVEGIRRGHGSNFAFKIAIRDLRVRRVFDKEHLILATYTEIQAGAINSDPPTNARVSTVLFGRAEQGGPLRWLHLHEAKSALS